MYIITGPVFLLFSNCALKWFILHVELPNLGSVSSSV